jgi:hypothetical protein
MDDSAPEAWAWASVGIAMATTIHTMAAISEKWCRW